MSDLTRFTGRSTTPKTEQTDTAASEKVHKPIPTRPPATGSHRQRRRRVLEGLAAGSVVATGSALPKQWKRPVIESVLMPVHAQTSASRGGGDSPSTTSGPPPDQSCGIVSCSIDFVEGGVMGGSDIGERTLDGTLGSTVTGCYTTSADPNNVCIDGTIILAGDCSADEEVTMTVDALGDGGDPGPAVDNNAVQTMQGGGTFPLSACYDRFGETDPPVDDGFQVTLAVPSISQECVFQVQLNGCG